MSDDNKQLLQDLDEKLRTIDDRLKQIAGYRFLPPNVKQEKESLEKQRNILEATRSRMNSDSGAGLDKEAPVESAIKSIESDGSESPVAMADNSAGDTGSDFGKELSASTNSRVSAAGGLVGDNYAVPHEDSKPLPEEVKEAEEDNRSLAQIKLEQEPDEFSLEEKKSSASTLEGVSKKVGEVVSSFKKSLDQSGDHPDRDYLAGIVDEFSKTVNNIIEKARGTQMSDNWRARAVKGRLASYVEAVKADFNFSELMNDEIETKIAELLS
ncbi:MAG: hypothetical protein WCT32_03770 [Patescibacteria group bacterium]